MPRFEIRCRPRGLTRDAISLACGKGGSGGQGGWGVKGWLGVLGRGTGQGCRGGYEGKATMWAGNVGKYFYFLFLVSFFFRYYLVRLLFTSTSFSFIVTHLSYSIPLFHFLLVLFSILLTSLFTFFS